MIMAVTRKQILKILKQSYLFQDIDDKELLKFLEACEVMEYKQGQLIYEQNAVASRMFLILEGRLVLLQQFEDGDDLLNTQNKGDIFGSEIFDREPYRASAAKAERDVLVLAMKKELLQQLSIDHPEINEIIAIQRKTLHHLLHKYLDWQQEDEIVYFMDHEHPFILFAKMLSPILGAFAFLLLLFFFYFTDLLSSKNIYILGTVIAFFGVAWAVWNAIDWNNDFFLITNKRVVFLETIALLYDSRRETPLTAILSITKQSDQLGRWLNYGDITVRTFTGLLTFKNVEVVEQVATLLNKKWIQAKERKEQEDQKEVETILRENVMNMEKDALEKEMINLEKNEENQDGLKLDFLSEFFGLRRVIGDSIIYRTHWFILIRKTILPAVGILGVFLAFILPIVGVPPLQQDISLNAILIASGVMFSLWWVYAVIDWRNDQYLIMPDQIVDVNRKPLGLEERRAAPMKNIQTIEYKRLGFFGLLFNFGTVFIRVGDVEFTFDYVPDPSNVQQELFHRFVQVMEQERDNLTERERLRLARWMNTYHRIINEKKENDSEPKDSL